MEVFKNPKIVIALIICGTIAFVCFMCSMVVIFTPSPDTSQNNSGLESIKNHEDNEITPSISPGTEEILYTVTKVSDGDTIWVTDGNKDQKIRLIGIDAPEYSHPTKPTECYSAEAKIEASEILLNKEVQLIIDETQGDKDQYDRLLRYISLEGQDFGDYMIRNGYVYEYTYDENYIVRNKYKQAQEEAKKNKRGLWAEDTCNGERVPVQITPSATSVITSTITPTSVVTSNVTPITTYVAPTIRPTTSGYVCNCSKTCKNMASCSEAYYQLNTCGCRARDGDGDGVPCESIC